LLSIWSPSNPLPLVSQCNHNNSHCCSFLTDKRKEFHPPSSKGILVFLCTAHFLKLHSTPEYQETNGCKERKCHGFLTNNNITLWLQSARELYRQSDRRLSADLLPTFAGRECRVVSVTDPYGRNLGFLDRSRYCFFQVAPQLYSRG
jgi:hypothetical protein